MIRAGSPAAWWAAIRPQTLTVSFAPVFVGTAVALRRGDVDWQLAGLCLLGALLLQVSSNLANDVFDARKGADGPARLGPPRAVSSGWLTQRQVFVALAGVLLAALGVGALIVSAAGWPIVTIGLTAMVSAVAYTAGPFPLGYRGLGDLFVFLYFGLAAVAGTTFVLTGGWDPLALILAIPVGAYGAAVLTVNNIRDLENDAVVGKRTLAVRLGPEGARRWYASLLLLPHLACLLLVALRWISPWALVSLGTLALAWPLIRSVGAEDDGPKLNACLARTARLQMLWALQIGPGIVIGS